MLPTSLSILDGTPNGIRTRVSAVKGQRHQRCACRNAQRKVWDAQFIKTKMVRFEGETSNAPASEERAAANAAPHRRRERSELPRDIKMVRPTGLEPVFPP